MKLLGDYIKSRRGVLLFFALAAALLGVSFALFHLPLRAVAYPCALALLLGLAALALDFRRVYKLHRELSQLETTAAELIGALPAAASDRAESLPPERGRRGKGRRRPRRYA